MKAVALLHAAADNPHGLTVSELARVTEIPRVTAGRIVATLMDYRLLQRQPNGSRIVLGSEVVRLGHLADVESVLIAAVAEHAEALRDRFRETVTLAVPRANGLEVIYQLDSSYAITTNWIGTVFPIHASSAGKILLAYSKKAFDALPDPLERFTETTPTSTAELAQELEDIRELGYAITEAEFDLELGGVSAPIFDPVTRAVVGILSVTAPSSRISGPAWDQVAEDVVKAANEIGERL